MLKDQAALVTGSTSGIGLGIATALAEAGANVMLNGFGDAAEIERIRADLAKRCGVQVLHSGADMSKPDQIIAMVRDAEARFGRLDVLVKHAAECDARTKEHASKLHALEIFQARHEANGAARAA